jgi:hypothetical protein
MSDLVMIVFASIGAGLIVLRAWFLDGVGGSDG